MKESLEYILFFCILFLASLIISLIYICYFIDRTKVNKFPFFVCYILFVFFIYLNLIALLDLVKDNLDYNDKKIRIINTKVYPYFYTCFNVINLAIRFVIFPICINYLETGYYSTRKIIFEPIFQLQKKILKKFCGKVNLLKAALIILLILAIAVVILYFMVRDKFGLDSPLSYFNYVSIALNLFSLFQVYINVGFFLVQCCIDHKRQRNPIYVKRYYYYSKIKVIMKCNKYLDNISKAREELEKNIANFQGLNFSPYCNYITKLLNLSQKNIQDYHLQKIKEDQQKNANNNNNNNHNQTYNNSIIINNNVNNNNNKNNTVNIINSNNNNNNINNMINNNNQNNNLASEQRAIAKNKQQNNVEATYDVRVEPIDEMVNNDEKLDKKEKKDDEELRKAVTELVNKTEEKAENDLADPIRSLKKAQRKLIRMKKRYKDLDEEVVLDLGQTLKHKIWIYFKYFILLLALIWVILSDILIPITSYISSTSNTNTTSDELISDLSDVGTNSVSDETDKEEDKTAAKISDFILDLIIVPCCFILTSSYSIIAIYSINRRYYISGDFLSGKGINDSINLMKTLKDICGYAFPLVYCNLYLFKMINMEDETIKFSLIFYDEFQIPDYEIKYGITIYMLAKLVIIVFSIIIFNCTNKLPLFKNDLGEFNRHYKDDNNNDPYMSEGFFEREIRGGVIDRFLLN